MKSLLHIPPARWLAIAASVASLLAIACLMLCASAGHEITLGGLALAAVVPFALKDADAAVNKTKALPNGAAAINSDGIDLGHTAKGHFLASCELLVSAPVLTTGELPDAQTMTYVVEHDTASDFASAATLLDNVIVQTGAGGAGAAAKTAQLRLPATVNQFVRVKATNSGAGDASGKSLTMQLVF